MSASAEKGDAVSDHDGRETERINVYACEACACVIEAWAVAFNKAGGNAPAMDGAQRAAKMLRGEANWPWTVAEVAAAFGGARGVMPQIPPRIADIGLRPGDLSFACAVDDHEWCEGCAACDCHHKEGDP